MRRRQIIYVFGYCPQESGERNAVRQITFKVVNISQQRVEKKNLSEWLNTHEMFAFVATMLCFRTLKSKSIFRCNHRIHNREGS